MGARSRKSNEHHDPNGGFRNPWPAANREHRIGAILRWRLSRITQPLPAKPQRGDFARAMPDIAYPAPPARDLRITWIGHSTFLIQIGGLNVLTDPHWSRRSSPVQWIGPARSAAPGVSFDALPPIHVVLISHDHYDHLDEVTVRKLAAGHPAAEWFAPLGHASYLRGLGAATVTDLDWWQESTIADSLRLKALPAQHWTRRIGSAVNSRLWCSFSIRSGSHHVYFGGDSGYCPAFSEIGKRMQRIDAALLPIGAYEPRWFMKLAHMNPEDALQAFLDLRAQHFIPMHWGTFLLTDEPALEPPERIRAAWSANGLAAERLHVLAFGETLRL